MLSHTKDKLEDDDQRAKSKRGGGRETICEGMHAAVSP